MKRFPFTFVFLIAAFFGTSQTQVRNLLIERMDNPVGIATRTPSFSWQLDSEERNVEQASYEILVASSLEKLEEGIADIWRSGRVKSKKTLQVRYEGVPLSSNTYYFVRVVIRTDKGEVVRSEISKFTVGFLNPSDWKGDWIGYDGAFPWDRLTQWSRLSARYHRKEFSANKSVERALVNIVGLGMYELFINRERIGDQVLAPAPTDYRKSVLSNTFDVTEFLHSGQNAVGVILGNGRFFTMRQNYKPYKINDFGFPKLLFQMDIWYEDGTRETIVSDETWKFTAEGPIRSNNEYDGEEYDANRKLGAWASADYKDDGWLRVRLVKSPEGEIRPQSIPPMKILRTIDPVSIHELENGAFILDMGQNFTGWIKIRVNGKKGDRVNLRFAESLQSNGELYMANLRDALVTDVFTLSGKGEETWEPRFIYHGFRYVEVTGWPGTPDISDFKGQMVYDEMRNTGNLVTSDPTLNAILKNAWWGIASNYKGMPVDCPQRNERQPWLGDRAQGAYGESFLFGNEAFYAKWLDDIMEAQTEEGAIPDVAPAYWNYYSDNVTWPGTYVLVTEMLYRQFGDRQSVIRHYPFMKKWLLYMQSNYLAEGILTKDKYGDWCVPPEDLETIRTSDPARNTDGPLIATAYFYHLLGIMEEFSEVVGKGSDARIFRALKEKIRKAFNEEFRNPDGSYDNGTITAHLLPFYFDLASDKEMVFRKIIEKLEADGMHISTGVIGTQWLMRSLSRHGRPDAALTLASNTTYPSWGYMIENGATTIWELWNGNTANPEMNSQNHIMLLGDLLIWMFEDVAGIRALKPGFSEIEMAPSFDSGLRFASASYRAPTGKIVSGWRITEDEMIHWHIRIPANTTAAITIPVKDIRQLRESNTALSSVKEIEIISSDDDKVRLRVKSGDYYFRIGG